MFNHSRIRGELEARRVSRDVESIAVYVVAGTSVVVAVWGGYTLTAVADILAMLV